MEEITWCRQPELGTTHSARGRHSTAGHVRFGAEHPLLSDVLSWTDDVNVGRWDEAPRVRGVLAPKAFKPGQVCPGGLFLREEPS